MIRDGCTVSRASGQEWLDALFQCAIEIPGHGAAKICRRPDRYPACGRQKPWEGIDLKERIDLKGVTKFVKEKAPCSWGFPMSRK